MYSTGTRLVGAVALTAASVLVGCACKRPVPHIVRVLKAQCHSCSQSSATPVCAHGQAIRLKATEQSHTYIELSVSVSSMLFHPHAGNQAAAIAREMAGAQSAWPYSSPPPGQPAGHLGYTRRLYLLEEHPAQGLWKHLHGELLLESCAGPLCSCAGSLCSCAGCAAD